MVNTTLHHYRIVRALGRGGMGEVYAAEDTKLHRQVALKILPQEMASDPERLQRFQREAQAVAALNHPNVVIVHSVEEADGVHFLTMEFVDGKTLVDLLPRRGLPLADFLKLAVPLVDAVGAAHQRGIVHRDLKPGNIMVGADGRLKVLDFGLAKLRPEPIGGAEGSLLTTAHLTGETRVLGTAAYMSPEQAEGRPVDFRSDVFSLGVVLYEMATGVRPFKGDTAMSLISSIIKDAPPPISDIKPGLPPDLDRILRRCLAKDPSRRYQSAIDLRNDLEELQQQAQPARASLRRAALWGVAIAVSAAVLVTIVYALRWRFRDPPLRASFTQLTSLPGVELFPSLSPDGKWMVYAGEESGNREIYLQSVGGQTPINLTNDPAEDDQPAFSPDGERIAFRSSRDGGGIFVMGRTGEAVRKVVSSGFNPTWSADGASLAYTSGRMELKPQNSEGRSELWVVNANGENARRLLEGDAVQPSWSPHNRRIAFYGRRFVSPGGLDIWTIPVAGGEPTVVMTDPSIDWNPVWSPDGRYLYFGSDRGGSMNLWRVRIDEESGKTLGEAEPITTPAPFLAHPSISADGRRMAYSSALMTTNIQKLALDPAAGSVTSEPVWVTTGSRLWSSPDPSPDGQWVVFYSQVQPEGDLYVVRSDGTGQRPVTSDAALDRVPRWSPDGKWIAYFSDRGGSIRVWKVRPDGSELQQLSDAGSYVAWSPDGSRLAISVATTVERNRTFIMDPSKPEAHQTPQALPSLESPRALFLVNSWSPDGERLAGYSSGAATTTGIVTYSLRTGTYERLTNFGEWPVWLPDSRHLLFGDGGKNFWLVDSQTKHVQKIYSGGRDVLGPPRLTRDGRHAFYSRRVTEADIWLMTLK